jgi:hypothetical protein
MTVGFIRSMILPGGGARTRVQPKSWTNRVWEIYERTTGKPRPEMFVEKVEEDDPRARPREDGAPV